MSLQIDWTSSQSGADHSWPHQDLEFPIQSLSVRRQKAMMSRLRRSFYKNVSLHCAGANGAGVAGAHPNLLHGAPPSIGYSLNATEKLVHNPYNRKRMRKTLNVMNGIHDDLTEKDADENKFGSGSGSSVVSVPVFVSILYYRLYYIDYYIYGRIYNSNTLCKKLRAVGHHRTYSSKTMDYQNKLKIVASPLITFKCTVLKHIFIWNSLTIIGIIVIPPTQQSGYSFYSLYFLWQKSSDLLRFMCI